MCLIGEQAIVIALGLILAVEAYDYVLSWVAVLKGRALEDRIARHT